MENTKPAYTGTVLLAESERSLREMVGTRLAREGYRVVPVNGGEQALWLAPGVGTPSLLSGLHPDLGEAAR